MFSELWTSPGQSTLIYNVNCHIFIKNHYIFQDTEYKEQIIMEIDYAVLNVSTNFTSNCYAMFKPPSQFCETISLMLTSLSNLYGASLVSYR